MEEMNFEETMEKLEQIANTLEKGDLSLEESHCKIWRRNETIKKMQWNIRKCREKNNNSTFKRRRA